MLSDRYQKSILLYQKLHFTSPYLSYFFDKLSKTYHPRKYSQFPNLLTEKPPLPLTHYYNIYSILFSHTCYIGKYIGCAGRLTRYARTAGFARVVLVFLPPFFFSLACCMMRLCLCARAAAQTSGVTDKHEGQEVNRTKTIEHALSAAKSRRRCDTCAV